MLSVTSFTEIGGRSLELRLFLGDKILQLLNTRLVMFLGKFEIWLCYNHSSWSTVRENERYDRIPRGVLIDSVLAKSQTGGVTRVADNSAYHSRFACFIREMYIV